MLPKHEEPFCIRNYAKSQLPFYTGIHSLPYCTIHHHDIVELSLVISGAGMQTVNDAQYPIRRGTLSLILPHELHGFTADKESVIQVFCCMVDIHIFMRALEHAEMSEQLLYLPELSRYVNLDEEQLALMLSIFEDLLMEMNSDSPGKKGMVIAKLTEALIRYHRQQTRAAGPEFRSDISRSLMWAILQHVHAHYMDEEMSLKDISRRFGASESYISRSFKSWFGHSFIRYIHSLRIRRASGLLVHTDMPIADIAVDAGFDSFRTFTRVFKSVTGHTPSGYRKASE